jgi:ABC-type lipoprotein export system ATPase subunit
MAILEELNRGQGLTIVLVTHEPDIAACADRVLTFRDGEVVEDEPRASAEEKPQIAQGEAGTDQ